MAAWSWSVVSSEEMVAVSATLVSHTQSVPKPPVASLRRCLHVCKQADSHLCTKIILTHDSLLLYILAALNYEICWRVFIVFQHNFDSKSLWQKKPRHRPTENVSFDSFPFTFPDTPSVHNKWSLVYDQCFLDWSKDQSSLRMNWK